MWGMAEPSEFQMADGVSFVSHSDGAYRMRVSIPNDPDGFLGRQCPECSRVFRIDSVDYEGLPEDIQLWCTYCGHCADHGEFITDQQRERVMRAAEDFGRQLVGKQLQRTFSQMRRPRSGRSGIALEFSVRQDSLAPRPLPDIDEERLVRVRECPECSLHYAVFAEHRFCPQCGQLAPGQIALDALAADRARLDAFAQLPRDAAAALREQGVFDRLWIDTMENIVGVVEALASAHYNALVQDAALRLRGKGNIFQRLPDTADLFADAGLQDLRAKVDAATWSRLEKVWAARHVFTHNDGIVDAKYLERSPQSGMRIGQRLSLSDALCREALVDGEVLCRAILALTP